MSLLKDHIDYIKVPEGASAIGYRTLSIVLSVFFFAFYSRVIFILFMGHEGFFSYDLYATGIFGLEVFFFTTELFLIIFSLAASGTLILTLKYLLCPKFEGVDWAIALMFLIMNVFTWYRLYPVVMQTPGNEMWMWAALVILTLLICTHLFVMCCRPPKESLKSLVVVLVGLIALTSISHAEMVSLLQLGLKQFGVGGEIPVTIKLRDSGATEKMSGKLVLLSPDHAYVVFEHDTDLSIIPRSIIEIIELPSGKMLSK